MSNAITLHAARASECGCEGRTRESASVSRLLSRLRVAVCGSPRRRGETASAFDAAGESAAEFAVELDRAAEAKQGWDLLLAFEGAEHAGEVAGGSDLRAYAAAERLAACLATEVVVAVAAGWLGDEFELAGAGVELDHRVAQVQAVELLSVGAAGVEVVERLREPGEVLLAQRG